MRRQGKGRGLRAANAEHKKPMAMLRDAVIRSIDHAPGDRVARSGKRVHNAAKGTASLTIFSRGGQQTLDVLEDERCRRNLFKHTNVLKIKSAYLGLQALPAACNREADAGWTAYQQSRLADFKSR